MKADTAAELAARLNAKVSSWSTIPNGRPVYTPSDIATALGLLKSERQRLWIHVAYCRQIESYRDLKLLMLEDIVNRYHHEHWQNNPNMLYHMIDTAVLEVLQAVDCPTCNGRKSRLIDSKFITCEACTGSGVKRASDYWRSSMCEIHRELWKRHWRDRYQIILDDVRGLDWAAKNAFAGNL